MNIITLLTNRKKGALTFLLLVLACLIIATSASANIEETNPSPLVMTYPNGEESLLLGENVIVDFTLPPNIRPEEVTGKLFIYLKQGNEFLGRINDTEGYLQGFTEWRDTFYLAGSDTKQAAPGDDYKLWIGIKKDANSPEDLNDPNLWSYVDESDSPFSIYTDRSGDPVKSINLLFPNGGEELVEGEQYEITWNSNRVTGVSILLNNVEWIAGNITNTGSYIWTASRMGLDTEEFKIQIFGLKGNSDGLVSDSSDYTFTIANAPAPQVLNSYPDGELPNNTNDVEMILTTDIPAFCRYNMHEDTPFDLMTPFTVTAQGDNRDTHSQVLTDYRKHMLTYVYVKCKGFNGAEMEVSHVVSFTAGKDTPNSDNRKLR